MKNRLLRVRELLQRELGAILARDHAFPGVLVTINDVDITPDLKNAHIFIGVVGPAHRQEEVVERLNKERGSLQSRVSKRVILKYTPVFHFRLDHSVERGVRVSRIMEEIDEQLIQSAILNPEPVEIASLESEPEEFSDEPETAAAAAESVEQDDSGEKVSVDPAADDGEESDDEEIDDDDDNDGAPVRVPRKRR